MGDGPRSSFLLCRDVLVYRLLRIFPFLAGASARQIMLAGGVPVYYRRNRGDLHTLREVWLAEVYRLPFDLEPHTVIDLGANIGLTSLWLTARYTVEHLVAVEPSATNLRVLRKNLTASVATVIHAAVGPVDGKTRFAESAQSHLGRVSSGGRCVRQVSMRTVLEAMPPETEVDLLKIDIEGAEEQLFSGDLSWLRRIRSIIIEIHPPLVDRDDIVARIRGEGFTFVPAGSIWPGSMDAFVRAAPR